MMPLSIVKMVTGHLKFFCASFKNFSKTALIIFSTLVPPQISDIYILLLYRCFKSTFIDFEYAK